MTKFICIILSVLLEKVSGKSFNISGEIGSLDMVPFQVPAYLQ